MAGKHGSEVTYASLLEFKLVSLAQCSLSTNMSPSVQQQIGSRLAALG